MITFSREELGEHYDKGVEIAEALSKAMPPSNNLALLIALGMMVGSIAKLSPDEEVRQKVLKLSAVIAEEFSKPEITE